MQRASVRRERPRDGWTDVARLLDANSNCAHVLGDAREVDLAEGPHFPRLLGLRPAIDAIEAALGLVAARIVIDPRDGVDAPTPSRWSITIRAATSPSAASI